MSYEKPIAPFEVIDDLIRYLWLGDEYDWPNTRVMVQVLFSITLFGYLGSRPGEIVESEAWKGSNEGLLYQDITLQRNAGPEYNGFSLNIRLRNRKGKRLQQGQK